jgi:hypothetical protein
MFVSFKYVESRVAVAAICNSLYLKSFFTLERYFAVVEWRFALHWLTFCPSCLPQ